MSINLVPIFILPSFAWKDPRIENPQFQRRYPSFPSGLADGLCVGRNRFAALPILEQFLTGIKQKELVEDYTQEIQNKYTFESNNTFDKNMNKVLKGIKKSKDLDEEKGG